jgi:hypothetical protein
MTVWILTGLACALVGWGARTWANTQPRKHTIYTMLAALGVAMLVAGMGWWVA